MRISICLLLVCCSFCSLRSQVYLSSVANGYGGGWFFAYDTVHIWAKEMPDNMAFSHWEGDTFLLENPDEWHTTFVTPFFDVSFSAVFKPVDTVLFETIPLADTLKDVFYFFPPSPDGLVYLFHGTGGTAQNWRRSIENHQMVRDLIAANFAVAFTSAEEMTKAADLDGDGKLHWIIDSLTAANNVDIANIAALTDTFLARGYISSGLKIYAIGMSNGAMFSGTVSNALGFTAAAPYCAAGLGAAYLTTSTATHWCMTKYDNHETVGTVGYTNALLLSELLDSHGVCSGVFLKDHTPVYPELFMRIEGVDSSNSAGLFNELKAKGFFATIGSYYYIRYDSDSLFAIVDAAPPGTYPLLEAISAMPGLKRSVSDQLDVCYAAHNFFADHNKRTIRFLRNPCAYTTGISRSETFADFEVFPVPAREELHIQFTEPGRKIIVLYNILGQPEQVLPLFSGSTILDVSGLSPGVYVLEVNGVRKKIQVE